MMVLLMLFSSMKVLNKSLMCLQRSCWNLHTRQTRASGLLLLRNPDTRTRVKSGLATLRAQHWPSKCVGDFQTGSELQSLCEDGHLDKALDVMLRMDEPGTVLTVELYRSFLKACTKRKALAVARQVHAHLAEHGLESTGFLGESVVKTLVRCGGLEDALQVFERLLHRTVVSWTAVISGYANAGLGHEALRMYELMREEGVQPNTYTFVSLLHACASIGDLEAGKRIHGEALKADCGSHLFVRTSLLDMYAKCGSIVDAQNVFDGLSERDLVSWNAMLAAYAQQGQPEKALELYDQMLDEGVSPDDRTFVGAVQACSILAEKEGGDVVGGQFVKVRCLEKGKAIHGDAWRKGVKSDVFIGSALVSMYGRCGSIVDAQHVFDGMSQRNVVAWNAMLAAYGEQGQAEKAFWLYREMLEEGLSSDVRTCVSALQACSMLADKEENVVVDSCFIKAKSLHKGRALHANAARKGYDANAFIGNTLVSLYGKCGSFIDAQSSFDSLADRDVVSWNAMLAAHFEQGQGEEALQLYRRMQDEGVSPNDITHVSILRACSNAGSLDLCRQIHNALTSGGSHLSPLLGRSLIHAYGKCASMVDAQNVFDSLIEPDVVSWTALLAGYGRQGNWVACLLCFKDMQLVGMKPNGVTFLSLLSACCNAGLVENGIDIFVSMCIDHGISPEMEHYACIIDLLGRAGYFAQVEELLSTMPMQPDLPMLLCLLGACRKHGKVDFGKQVFESALRLEPQHSAAYVLMSNIYADAGLWELAQQAKELRQRAGAWKKPGQSWIEHGQQVHTFGVGDCKHDQQDQLYVLLEKLTSDLEEGHAPKRTVVIHRSASTQIPRVPQLLGSIRSQSPSVHLYQGLRPRTQFNICRE